MKEKLYKARVEISLMVEVAVNACHEDNAAAVAEDIATAIVVSGFNHVSNYSVKCTEVEEV